MNGIKWILMTCMLFRQHLVCYAQKSWITNVAVGQGAIIPCGVQVREPINRLVWKLDYANNTENLAYSFDSAISCNTNIRENCLLSSDGSLELYNVQETDSGDYFCVLDDEKYYSQHTLVVHPKVAFETCLNPEDVFVTQTGPDEIVLAYTKPVCSNADVIGVVSCDPPSGARIEMSFTEIVCTCSHSGNVVDTCQIPIPDASPSFEDCSESASVSGSKDASPSFENCSESASVSGSKDDGIVCPQVTALGIFLGIFIGAVLGGVGRLIEYFCKKHSLKQSANKEKKGKSGECEEMLNGTIITYTEHNESNTKPELRSRLQPDMTVIQGEPLELKFSVTGYPIPTILWFKDGKQFDPQAGYKTTFSEGVAMLTVESTKEGDKGMFSCVVFNPAGSDITSCNVVVKKLTVTMQPSDENGTSAEVHSDVTVSRLPCTNPNESDSNYQTGTQSSIPCCTEIREFVVEDVSANLRILPSTTNPTGGIAISCNRAENLTVGFHKGDLSTIPKPSLDPLNGGMTISVADTVAVPVHINCLECGNSCCTLEVNGGEWSKKQPETDCKITCNEKDAEEI